MPGRFCSSRSPFPEVTQLDNRQIEDVISVAHLHAIDLDDSESVGPGPPRRSFHPCMAGKVDSVLVVGDKGG